jgi:hypothetical protein
MADCIGVYEEGSVYISLYEFDDLTRLSLGDDSKKEPVVRQLSLNYPRTFDTHCSFSLLHLTSCTANDISLIIATTSTSRIILMNPNTGYIIKNLYGINTDGFSVSKSVFVPPNTLITSSCNDIVNFNVYNETVNEQIREHKGVVRDICGGENMVGGCGYDKFINLWFIEK